VTRRRPSRLRLVLTGLGIAVLVLTARVRPRAQSAVATPSPLTAGSLVLLANQPGVDMTRVLKNALTDPDPAIRIVAARQVGVLRTTALEDELAHALDVEPNARVSGEQVRSLLLLDDAQAMVVVAPDPLFAAARLVLRSNDAGADLPATLRSALTDADPAVRFVAARLTSVLRVHGLDDDVAHALANEANAQVAAEDVRALLFLDTPAATTTVQQYVRHAKVPAALAYAWWLARMHPERMPDDLPALVGAMHYQAYWLVDPMNSAVGRAPALAPRLFEIYARTISPEAWWAVLRFPGGGGATAALRRAALTSSRGDIRARMVWDVVSSLANGWDVVPDILEAAVAETPALDSGSTVTWEQYGREIVRRETERQTTPDRADWLRTEAARHPIEAQALGALGTVTPPERVALEAALGSTFHVSKPKPRTAPAPSKPRAMTPMRTYLVPWPGLLSAVLDAAGCKITKAHHYEGMDVTYRADGRPDSVVVHRSAEPTPCNAAATALSHLLLATPDEPITPGMRQTVLIPTEKAVVACVDRPDVIDVDPNTTMPAATTVFPVLKRHDKLAYPPNERKAHRSGTPHLDTVISSTGCIESAFITDSAGPAFDLNALDATMHWYFAPYVVDGVPRPMQMEMTMTFNFHE
jgi:TonB family protein